MAKLLWAPAVATTALVLAAGRPAEPTAEDLAAAVRRSQQVWQVPGVAVAVVRGDRVVLLDGFGVTEIGRGRRVDADTLFPLASCTKGFTCTLLAQLADDGKLSWDDPVRRHLPDFHLSGPLADGDVRLRDLVTHRTGVGSHDLLWYRAKWNLEGMVRRVGKLPLERPFRTHFEYQSVMVTAAGLAAATAGGAPWADLVRRRITDPLEMTSVTFTTAEALKNPNRATGHRPDRTGHLIAVPWYDNPEPNPAGSLSASARDLSHWLTFQLGDGRYQGRRLLSAEALAETHTPQQVIPFGPVAALHSESHLTSYALGWVVQDYRGHELVSHAGIIDGFRAHLTLLPKDGWGIAVLANVHATRLNLALSNTLVDLILGLPPRDWDQHIRELVRQDEEKTRKEVERREELRNHDAPPALPLADLAGDYEDPAYGRAQVRLEGGRLMFAWSSFRLPLEHYQDETFTLRDLALNDPQVTFRLSPDRRSATALVLGDWHTTTATFQRVK